MYINTSTYAMCMYFITRVYPQAVHSRHNTMNIYSYTMNTHTYVKPPYEKMKYWVGMLKYIVATNVNNITL